MLFTTHHIYWETGRKIPEVSQIVNLARYSSFQTEMLNRHDREKQVGYVFIE